MSRRKKPLPTDEPITGVTTYHGNVIRVYFGRNTVVKLSELDDKTARSLTRQARAWMKPPPGSIPIHGHNKPRKPDHVRVDYSNDWGASDTLF